jgi:hypothetical protein
VIRQGRRLAILAGLVAGLACPTAAWAARPLALGVSDSAFLGPQGATWLQRSASAGAHWVRLDIGWDVPNTPQRPAGFNALNPADPHYDFSAADKAIKAATQLGLHVLVTFTGAPEWAQAPGRPAADPPGTWRPNLPDLEQYGVALGLRYSGHFPDPSNPGHMLPRVAAFQVWNEPNLSAYLNPQWSGGQPAAPVIYRAMLNAFYQGVKSVDPGVLVVTAGTAPFGDPQPGGQRLQPALFWQVLLCLRTTAHGGLASTHCSNPAHFDVFDHHPYSWGSPTTHAYWPNDVAIPDMGKLTRLLRAAERTGDALPHIHHPVWVTEIGYNSNPPIPGGLSLSTQARWLEQTFDELWAQGVSVVFWFQIVDQAPDPTYADVSDSGLFFVNGQPKPALTSFEFPEVASPGAKTTMQVWGRAPSGGQLKVQVGSGSTWRTVRALRVSGGGTFVTSIPRGSGGVRAVVGNRSSLTWRLR